VRPTRLFSRNADVNAVNKQELAVRHCTHAATQEAHTPLCSLNCTGAAGFRSFFARSYRHHVLLLAPSA